MTAKGNHRRAIGISGTALATCFSRIVDGIAPLMTDDPVPDARSKVHEMVFLMGDYLSEITVVPSARKEVAA